MNNTDSATSKKRKNMDVGINATKQQNCKIAKQLNYAEDDNSVISVHNSTSSDHFLLPYKNRSSKLTIPKSGIQIHDYNGAS